MARVTELGIRDVRCFAGEQTGRLARVTLLVGPNSAGKSTFLGCYKTLTRLADLHKLDDVNHFDEQPFSMGGFDTIARTGCDTFSVTAAFAEHCHSSARFDFAREAKGDPRERRLGLDWQDGQIEISFDLGPPESLLFENPRFSFRLDRRPHISYTQISTWLSRAVKYGNLPFNSSVDAFKQQGQGSDVVAFSRFLALFQSELPLLDSPVFNVIALDPSPEPRQRAHQNEPRPLWGEDREELAFLADLGARLGLWKEVKIRAGKQGFAIMVRTAAGTHNLLDVGYGVHGVLPLARAFYEQPSDAVLLLQQPEVHLHPEAQANLAQYMGQSEQGFVIETHSDHFLDRFRICVMRGELEPEDLSVLYFEPLDVGNKTIIHSIAVDESANLLNLPTGFRDFFNRETNLLLGFEE